MFRLAHTEYLWGLLIIPICLLVYLAYRMWRARSLERLADASLAGGLIPERSTRKPFLRFLFTAISLLCLVLALTGPQIGSRMEETKREGVDLMICLDISNSMLAEDLSPNRLERAKRAVEKLIDRLRSDRIGIVVFAGKAFVQLPMTTDYAAAKLFLKTVNTETIALQGTAIGSALELALESFNYENPTGKAIIVISDGENHEDNAIQVARQAAELDVIVHTIGMGSENGSPIPIYRGSRSIGFRKDRSGNTVVTKLNADMLASVAEAGNGQFVRATNADAGLDYIFDEIETMEKTEFGSKIYTDYENRFQYLVAVALLFLLFELMLLDRKNPWLKKINLFSSKS